MFQCNDVIEKLLRGIDSLFKMIRCDNAPLLELLGDNTHVNLSNVMLYLGLIEKRVIEMFHRIYWVDLVITQVPQLRLAEEKKYRMKTPLVNKIVPTQPCAL